MQPDMSGTVHAPGAEGFLVHIRQLAASLLGHAAMRFELLSIEVQEEKARLVRLAISAALVSALLIVSVVMAAVLILVIYWDTPYRVNAAAWLAGIFSLFTIGSGLYLSAQLRVSSTLFTASASELRRDAEGLASIASPP